jgi:hypothetical protein
MEKSIVLFAVGIVVVVVVFYAMPVLALFSQIGSVFAGL